MHTWNKTLNFLPSHIFPAEQVALSHLCTAGWTSSSQRAGSGRTDAPGEWGACRWSAPRSAGRRNAPPPGARRAPASPLYPGSTAPASAPHPWPPASAPPRPDSSSAVAERAAAGISLLAHARTRAFRGLQRRGSTGEESRRGALRSQAEFFPRRGRRWISADQKNKGGNKRVRFLPLRFAVAPVAR